MRNDTLRKLGIVGRVDLVHVGEDGVVECLNGILQESPVVQNEELRQKLLDGAQAQKMPYVFRDSFEVYFAALQKGNDVYLMGPMSAVKMDRVALRQFYQAYDIRTDEPHMQRFYPLQEVLSLVQLLAFLVAGKEYTEEELARENQLASARQVNKERDLALFQINEDAKNEDAETWRHTYRQELQLHDAVASGDATEAVRLNRAMDLDAGRLSDKELGHWKNMAVIGITLSSRAAIDGGMAPQKAYQVSGRYIQKVDACRTVSEAIRLREQAVFEMANLVRERKEHRHTSSYTESAKAYVALHYREKIYLQEIADEIGVSATYLSRRFKEDTGVALQDYICSVRVDRACDLLKYSDHSLAEIASYVNFPTQSYFGKKFKAQMNMTPKEYRDRFKAADLTIQNG